MLGTLRTHKKLSVREPEIRIKTPRWVVLCLCSLFLILCSCNTTKFVPQDKYLLNKVRVKCVDDKNVSTATLGSYVRQKQNTEIFGFWKLQLHVYNTAPLDTTTKARARAARNAKKMGEAPIIYDEELTEVSMQQIRQQMNNMGYFQAEVDTQLRFKKRKVEVTYLVTANQPYYVRQYEVDIPIPEICKIARDERCKVHPGEQFSTSNLDAERERITSTLRNQGYYYFEKSILEFTADSSLNSHQVDIRLHLAPYVSQLDSTEIKRLNTRYSIRDVNYSQDIPFLRKGALRRASRIRSGERYAEWRVERTYAKMNALPPVKYVDIAFVPVGDTLLDCNITVSRSRLNSVTAEMEGTYSAGDWGIAAGLRYSNKNIFHGAEVLTVGARASYEWRANGGRAIEARADASLLFPSNVKVEVAYNYQQRPDEYTRTIANASLSYRIPRTPSSRWTHEFNLVDINYIYVPWMSEEFKRQFIDRSSVLKASYEDHFIVDWSYTCTYSTFNPRFPNRSYLQFALRAETAGNFLYALSELFRFPKNEDGSYIMGNIPFSQYAKGDFNFTYHGIITQKHHLVTHIGFGAAVPYLNAKVIPFEKRYFGGGASGVRGWQARTLGPGTFRNYGSTMAYDLQVGDIHLEMNLEYRFKVLRFLELAAFTDAGNIWTIYDYDSQPGGVFTADFYKQIAWSYGVGLRFDLSVMIFRVDFGVKLYDPSRIDMGSQWRTAYNGLCWKDDMTFHFAIGYPF